MDIKRRRLLTTALAAVGCHGVARGQIGSGWSQVLPGAKRVGQGRLRVMGFPVYLAELWAEEGHYEPHKPFVLSLTYLRDISRTQIINASLDRMHRLGAPVEQHPDWAEQLATVFRDVNELDNISGVFYPGDHAQFYFNDRPTGVLQAALADRLASIWLSPQTSEPALSRALLGQTP